MGLCILSACSSETELDAVEGQADQQEVDVSPTLRRILAVVLQETHHWMQNTDNFFTYLDHGSTIALGTPEALYDLRKEIALGLMHANVMLDNVQWAADQATAESYLQVAGPLYMTLYRSRPIRVDGGTRYLGVSVGMRDLSHGWSVESGEVVDAFIPEASIHDPFSEIEGYWYLATPTRTGGRTVRTLVRDLARLPEDRTCGNLAAERGLNANDALCLEERVVQQWFCPAEDACNVSSALKANDQWRILAENTVEPDGKCRYCLAYNPSMRHKVEPSFEDILSSHIPATF